MDAQPPRPAATMKTVDKALFVLDFFTVDHPEWRLSDLARASGIDKATTMRVLASLAARGFVQQDEVSRRYRLGHAVLRLARVREASFPVGAVLQPIVTELAEATGETGHASIRSGSGLVTVAIAEPGRATRVFVDPVQPLPFHATASGLVYLSRLPEPEIWALLGRLDREAFTQGTPVAESDLRSRLDEARRAGFAIARGTFEGEVTGIAAPVFDGRGAVEAVVAAACMTSRMNPEGEAAIAVEVRRAAAAATRALGGTVPPDVPPLPGRDA